MNTDECFAPWVRWADKSRLPDKSKSGVYIIGRFENKPPLGPADPLDKGVVYVGESSTGRLQSRWRSFERSVGSKGKHRGGKRYKEMFGEDLSVAYISTLSDDRLVKAFLRLDSCAFLDISASDAKVDGTDELLWEIDDLLIKYIERRLILLHSLANGRRPACNVD